MKVNGKKLWHWLSIFGYILTYSVLLRENMPQLLAFNRGDLNISASAVPMTRTYLRQREMESYNILNCSNNKTMYGNVIFCHNKWVAKRQSHRNFFFLGGGGGYAGSRSRETVTETERQRDRDKERQWQQQRQVETENLDLQITSPATTPSISDTTLKPTDPRWIGAWWMGFLLVGGLAIVPSLPMLFFPRRMPFRAGQSS